MNLFRFSGFRDRDDPSQACEKFPIFVLEVAARFGHGGLPWRD